jgi:hypothetical protein
VGAQQGGGPGPGLGTHHVGLHRDDIERDQRPIKRLCCWCRCPAHTHAHMG